MQHCQRSLHLAWAHECSLLPQVCGHQASWSSARALGSPSRLGRPIWTQDLACGPTSQSEEGRRTLQAARDSPWRAVQPGRRSLVCPCARSAASSPPGHLQLTRIPCYILWECDHLNFLINAFRLWKLNSLPLAFGFSNMCSKTASYISCSHFPFPTSLLSSLLTCTYGSFLHCWCSM